MSIIYARISNDFDGEGIQPSVYILFGNGWSKAHSSLSFLQLFEDTSLIPTSRVTNANSHPPRFGL